MQTHAPRVQSPILYTIVSPASDEGRRLLQEARVSFREEVCDGIISTRSSLREFPALYDDAGAVHIGVAAIRQYAALHRHHPCRSASSGWA